MRYNSIQFGEDRMKKYFNDSRWKEATELCNQCKFADANELVRKIMIDHGCLS